MESQGKLMGSETKSRKRASSGAAEEGSPVKGIGGVEGAFSDDDNDNYDETSTNDNKSDDNNNDSVLSKSEVLRRIEEWIVLPIMMQLDRLEPPYLSNQNRTSGILRNPNVTRRLQQEASVREGSGDDDDDDDDGNDGDQIQALSTITANFQHLRHCRKLTSILLVAAYCHELLLHGRTTATLREVYYYYCTHFHSQSECNSIIQSLSEWLQVPRSSLGLLASPKGWWSGYLTIRNKSTNELLVQGHQGLQSLHGMPIAGTSLDVWKREYRLDGSNANCILVIESESVYTRLVEESFWTRYPCILVTGKGFPDLATRSWVQYLQQQLGLPAYGICDCNPYGVSVLQTYTYRQENYSNISSLHPTNRDVDDIEDDSVQNHNCPLDLKWIGLRPSQVAGLDLPSDVLQDVTERDLKRVEYLEKDEHRSYCKLGSSTRSELEYFKGSNQCKVELEALHWKGMDFLCNWLAQQLLHFEQLRQREVQGQAERSDRDAADEREDDDDNDESNDDSTNLFSSYRI